MALVDEYGFEINTRLLNGAERCSNSRPSWPVRTEDIHKAIPISDWRTHLSVSRRLYANNGIIKGAINDKAMFAIGRAWEPQFLGQDVEWGKVATEWLREEWYVLGNTRGRSYDFKTALLLLSVCIDRDGEVFVLLAETPNGYPKIQIIPAHRVGQRNSGEKTVTSGLFSGYKINQGIITAPWGEEVGFRVLGDTELEDHDVSANDMLHLFDPEYPDQLRGLSIFSHALNDWRDADQSQNWEQLAQLIYSSLVLMEHNESGGSDPNDPGSVLGNTVAGEQTVSRELFDGGATRYYRANSGSKLEAFVATRPSDAWDTFQDRIARKALANVWPYPLIWKHDGANGTSDRTTIEKARNLIRDRQDLIHPAAIRVIGWAISKAINQRRIPEYKGKDRGGFLRWVCVMPAEFNIDHGRESKQWLEMNLRGAENIEDYLLATGKGSMAEHLARRERETNAILDTAKRIQAKHPELPLETAINLVRQATPNPPPMTQPSSGNE